MARDRYRIYENAYPVFATCTIVNWYDLLKPPEVKQLVLDSLQFLRKEDTIKLFCYVIMHNHLHMIISSSDISASICRFKSYTAKRIIQYYKEQGNCEIIGLLEKYKKESHKHCEYQVWQEGYHPKQIINMKMFQQKIDYICLNPVRKGYVDSLEKWKWSSAYSGGDVDIVMDW